MSSLPRVQDVRAHKREQFNGVDIDWEFPNGEPTDANDVNWDRGNTCFAYDPNDTANMLAVIKVMPLQKWRAWALIKRA